MSYVDCLYRLADAYKAYLKAHDIWTLHTFHVWHAILCEADRVALLL
jgi:hypothetical protein